MKDTIFTVPFYEQIINDGESFRNWGHYIYEFGIFSEFTFEKNHWNVDHLKKAVLYNSLQPEVKTIFDGLISAADNVKGKTDAEVEGLYEKAWQWRGIEGLKEFKCYFGHEEAIKKIVARTSIEKLRQLAIERTAIGMATQFLLAKHIIENRHESVADYRDWGDTLNIYWYQADAGASSIYSAVKQLELEDANRKQDKNFASMQISTISYNLYCNPAVEWKTKQETG